MLRTEKNEVVAHWGQWSYTSSYLPFHLRVTLCLLNGKKSLHLGIFSLCEYFRVRWNGTVLKTPRKGALWLLHSSAQLLALAWREINWTTASSSSLCLLYNLIISWKKQWKKKNCASLWKHYKFRNSLWKIPSCNQPHGNKHIHFTSERSLECWSLLKTW